MNLPKIAVFVLAVLATSLGANFAAAERGYYKWTDSRGNTQHSDRPPPVGVEYEFVSTQTGFGRRMADTPADAPMAATGAPAAPSQASAEPAAKHQVAIKKDPTLCSRAKSNLATLNSTAQVRIREKGEIRILTQEEKDKQVQRAEKTISVHCEA